MENAEKIMSVLKEFGFENTGLKKEDFIKPDTIFQMGFRPNRIDIITGITGVTFEDAYKNRVKSRFGSEEVCFISAQDLLRNKKATTRAIDIADAEVLERFIKKKL
jgi:hypothetical protein